MNEPIDYQIIEHNGHPAFAVVPYEKFIALLKQAKDDVYFPDEVVRLNVIEGLSLLRAWREYKRLTQKEVAKKAGISQPALAQLEHANTKMRKSTLKKLARALDIDFEQLII
jgi:DNA-binding XRE family transcriptional regulator